MLALSKALPDPADQMPPPRTGADDETQRIREWVNKRWGTKREEW